MRRCSSAISTFWIREQKCQLLPLRAIIASTQFICFNKCGSTNSRHIARKFPRASFFRKWTWHLTEKCKLESGSTLQSPAKNSAHPIFFRSPFKPSNQEFSIYESLFNPPHHFIFFYEVVSKKEPGLATSPLLALKNSRKHSHL